jgi:predicted Holliday junction resolvase-like endonuclease
MEDMAEDTIGEDTKEENIMEEDIMEEDIKEETIEDIKEDLIRRSAIFIIRQVIGQLSTLLRNTKRHMRSSANIPYIH